MKRYNIKIDKIDKDLIKLLTRSNRQSSLKLSKELGVSAATVRRRTNRLFSNSIVRIIAVPEASDLGYHIRMLFCFKVSMAELNATSKILVDRIEIKSLSLTSGRYNLTAIAWFRDAGELSYFMKDTIAKLPGIQEVETLFNINTIKRESIH